MDARKMFGEHKKSEIVTRGAAKMKLPTSCYLRTAVRKFTKLMSAFYASVVLLIMNFVIILSK